jgi:protein tyrosine/serine phosphatase
MPSRFVEVIPDSLYRGGAPDLEEIPMLKKEWGIEKIISLDRDSGIKIKDECKKHGIKHLIIPVHSFKHEEAMKQIDDIGPAQQMG